MRKPAYIDPAVRDGSASLAAEPPFVFRAVTTRVFPVKANPARLYGFIDRYLNDDIPPSIAHFRPSLPYVYVMVLNYGKMAPSSVHAQNLGWVAQNEVLFTVPLTWWRQENERLVFKDWAFVSPFIFVDSALSQTTGREVYGWPKVMGRVDAQQPLWAEHPLAGSRLFTLSAKVFPKTYAGQREAPRVLLQVDLDPSPTYTQSPPRPSNPWNPLNSLPRMAGNTLGLMGDALDMLAGLRLRGFHRSPESTLSLLGSSSRNLAGLLPGLLLPRTGPQDLERQRELGMPEMHIEQITLKQFRDVQSPNDACYQALVASTMGFDCLNQGGLLGDVNLLRGDPSGGFTLRIHRYPNHPIVDALGMEVSRIEEGDDAPVDVLKPTLPFWTDVDLFYGPGRVICSRTPSPAPSAAAAWRAEQPEPPGARRPSKGAKPKQQAASLPRQKGQNASGLGAAVDLVKGESAAQPGASAETAAQTPGKASSASAAAGWCPPDDADTAEDATPCRIPYNTTRGAATQPISGPFRFPDVTVQVYPLLADPARLVTLLDRYLNQPIVGSGLRFETAGSYVYLLVNHFGEQLGSMWSESNNIGWWADREVSFCVPVKWFHNDELVGLALTCPFVFANSGRAAITDREVNGRPTVRARIDSPADVWMSDSGPVAPRRLLEVETDVFPALHLGQQAQQRTLLELDMGDSLPQADANGWRLIAQHWGETLVRDLKRKQRIEQDQGEEIRDALALAHKLLGQAGDINWITLKQYRDAAKMDVACYQALVHTTRRITALHDLREIESRVHLRLHRYPGQPIADTLGLAVKWQRSRGGNVVQDIQPIRPFWMRASMEEDLGRVLCWRAEDADWTLSHPWLKPQTDDKAAHPAPHDHPGLLGDGDTSVGAGLCDLGCERPLKEQVGSWLQATLTEELAAVIDAVGALSTEERSALAAQVGARLDCAAPALDGKTTPASIAQALSGDALLGFVDAWRAVLGERLGPLATKQARLSRADTRAALGRLDDVQVVLEHILSQCWEHGDPERRAKAGDTRQPALRIREDSVGPAADGLLERHPELEPDGDGWWRGREV
jgi:hypothetical protein